MADELEIFIPEGVVIEVTALPGAELLTGASSQYWSDAVPSSHRRDIRRVLCLDQSSFLNALGLELSE
jgi:hypothetical protein